MRKLHSSFLALLCCALAVCAARAQEPQNSAARMPPKLAPERFEKEINALLALDKTNPPPHGAILFTGSSIIRKWDRLSEQMAPLPVFDRAFGGSVTTDLLYYMDKVVLPYEPRIIVYYCGSNDINAGRKAAAVFDGFRQFAERVHAALPKTRILYISINRAPQKESKWNVVNAANDLARNYCVQNGWLGFIDVNPALFDSQGKSRLELFQPDKLHFREPAYNLLTAIIKPVLAAAWQEAGKPQE
ncbi:MAG TPA: GDSL-type esterase/lipase family protein [Verrucomicrobiae bacterium]